MTPRILIIDDEEGIRDTLRMILKYEGYDVLQAATGEDGVRLIERDPPDLVFLDIKMPGMDGIEVLRRIQHLTETLPVVVISGHVEQGGASSSEAAEAMKLGARDFIEKPPSQDRILVTVRNALEGAALRRPGDRCREIGGHERTQEYIAGSEPHPLQGARRRNIGAGGDERRGPRSPAHRAQHRVEVALAAVEVHQQNAAANRLHRAGCLVDGCHDRARLPRLLKRGTHGGGGVRLGVHHEHPNGSGGIGGWRVVHEAFSPEDSAC